MENRVLLLIVLQEDTNCIHAVFVDHFLEILDISFVLQDLDDLKLQLKCRNLNFLMLSHASIRDLCQHICNRITYSHVYLLPAGFGNAWDLPFTGKLPKANPAHFEFPHITAGSSTNLTAVDLPGTELRRSVRLDDH